MSQVQRHFGIDLIQAAKNELAFLEEVAKYPNLRAGPLLREAIRRYEQLWLPLAARHSTHSQMAAPLDIAWVWHVHMLAPYHYEKDCANVVSKIVDHSPLDVSQRQEGLQNAERLWRKAFPAEPFEVDLNNPPTVVINYQSRIQYKLEEGCLRQFKFYYQVSLPHYRDDQFLSQAVDRYEHHLHLKSQHLNVFMVPCYDFDLIWHVHQLHPLNYRHATEMILGKPLHHDDTETSRTPGSKLYDSEIKTREVWAASGKSFFKPGAMYRGDPPEPRPPRSKWFYAALARSEYPCEFKSIDAQGLKRKKTFVVRLVNIFHRKLFSQKFKGDSKASNPRAKKFTFDNGDKNSVNVRLYRKKLFGERFIAQEKLNLLPYLEDVPFVDHAVGPYQQITIDVPLVSYPEQYVAKVTVGIDYPTIVKYSFQIQAEKHFTYCAHPSMILSYPLLTVISPNDLCKPSVPCEYSIHPVLDWRENQVFSCRVVHSTDALLSAAEIISVHGKVVATSHTIGASTLPEKGDVRDHENSVYLEQKKGERAMLIRGQKDWAICISRWQWTPKVIGRRNSKAQHYVKIRVFKLFGQCGWCSVRKYENGLFIIKVDSDTMVRIDLKENKVVLSPRAQDIPELLALAFSVSILYLLCTPYEPEPPLEPMPSLA